MQRFEHLSIRGAMQHPMCRHMIVDAQEFREFPFWAVVREHRPLMLGMCCMMFLELLHTENNEPVRTGSHAGLILACICSALEAGPSAVL